MIKLRRTRVVTAAIAALVPAGIAGCGGSSGRPPAAIAGSGPVSATAAGWPTLLHDGSHFGASTAEGPVTPTVKWERRLGGPIVAAPITVGRVAYVASDDGVLHALQISSGRELWSFNGGASYGVDLSTAPVILPSGLIVWPGPRDLLFGLTSAGKLVWTIHNLGSPLTPVIDAPGHELVFADTAGTLCGYTLATGRATPRRLWTMRLAKVSFGNPALAMNGTIYETAGASLFAVSETGQIMWRVTTPRPVEVSAAVSQDGTVIFGSDDRDEYGITPRGAVRWRRAIGNYTYSSPLTLAGNRVAFGDHSGNLNLWNTTTGQPIAKDAGAGQVWTSAAVDRRGDVYFASRTGGIYAFGPNHQQLFKLQTDAKFDSYPAIAADGTLLIGDDSGVLRAIGGP